MNKVGFLTILIATLFMTVLVCYSSAQQQESASASSAQLVNSVASDGSICIGKSADDPTVCSGKGVCRSNKCYCPLGSAGEACECTYDTGRTCRGPTDNE